MEDSLSSAPHDSDAVEMHHFKFHQTNGSVNGLQERVQDHVLDHGTP